MVVESDGLLDESCRGAAPLPQEAVRVKLDVPRADDLADLVFLANNKKVASNLSTMPYPFKLDDGRALIAKAENPAANSSTFAIRLKATGRLIGTARYAQLEPNGPVHVGYWIGEPFWGNGYATEAVHTLVDHAFAYQDVSELTAACRVTNPASRRVLVKSGFQYRDQSLIRSVGAGGTVPTERYSLERGVWASLKEWGRAT
ncbi:RimJ/RimL family protein N-acetyltransferase [Roseibium hamelinense]|uniref:RimJ/RimL family protein N-acetyltransferase n=1 Tax=Roseibium hamelinense TaxID=150831 RepID=A0A562T0Z5_9HYPH|nr:GNAT family N-acetyltransferase [Roseibium hamelinense]MTI43778.1 N-acetyltransferase [Roseibium hamelinense]TWI87142.1 RimJ/RimL family protein N-acetyltransferase [Roseibium hamelinense]